MTNLSVPPRVIVGRVSRRNTFSGTLSFVVPQQESGAVGSEKSLSNWMDHDLGIITFENVPSSTFWVAKGHTRYSSSHFGNSKNSLVRIYDERTDSEFEISVENLGEVLVYCDIVGQHIEGNCLYAHSGGKVYLLPEKSEFLEEAKNKSKIKSMAVKKSELVPGCTVMLSNGKVVVYLGDFYSWEWAWKGYDTQERKKSAKKRLTFGYIDESEEIRFTTYASASSVAQVLSSKVSDNFEELWLAREKSIDMNQASLDKMLTGKMLKDALDSNDYSYSNPYRDFSAIDAVMLNEKGEPVTLISVRANYNGQLSASNSAISIANGEIKKFETGGRGLLGVNSPYMKALVVNLPQSTPGPLW